MKILLIFIYSLCVLFGGSKNQIAKAETTDTTTYAKALVGCNLYKEKEMKEGFENVLFQIPETYFVIILETVSDECFKVQYDKYIGFVDSSTVTIATFIPILKTLTNISFDIKSTSGTQIWQYPTPKSTICTTIAAGTKNITYIAYTYGSVPTGGESNIWYYVQFTPDSNSTNVYEGYIYSENTTNLSDIVANTETNPEVIADEKGTDKLIFISSTIKTIIITIVVIPVILFFAIILYKIIKKVKNNTKYAKFHKNSEDEFQKENNVNQNMNQMEKYKDMRLLKNKNTSQSFSDFDDDELL